MQIFHGTYSCDCLLICWSWFLRRLLLENSFAALRTGKALETIIFVQCIHENGLISGNLCWYFNRLLRNTSTVIFYVNMKMSATRNRAVVLSRCIIFIYVLFGNWIYFPIWINELPKIVLHLAEVFCYSAHTMSLKNSMLKICTGEIDKPTIVIKDITKSRTSRCRSGYLNYYQLFE